MKQFDDQIQVTDEIIAISKFNGLRALKEKSKSNLRVIRNKSNSYISRPYSKYTDNQTVTSSSYADPPKSGKTQKSQNSSQETVRNNFFIT